MSKMTTRLILAFASIMSAAPAWADRSLPGYQCLSMNATPSQASNPNFMLTVRQAPSDQAPVMGTAGDLLIASNPVIQQNGYIQNHSARWETRVDPGFICEALAFSKSC